MRAFAGHMVLADRLAMMIINTKGAATRLCISLVGECIYAIVMAWRDPDIVHASVIYVHCRLYMCVLYVSWARVV
jgi:hypothetical protein